MHSVQSSLLHHGNRLRTCVVKCFRDCTTMSDSLRYPRQAVYSLSTRCTRYQSHRLLRALRTPFRRRFSFIAFVKLACRNSLIALHHRDGVELSPAERMDDSSVCACMHVWSKHHCRLGAQQRTCIKFRYTAFLWMNLPFCPPPSSLLRYISAWLSMSMLQKRILGSVVWRVGSVELYKVWKTHFYRLAVNSDEEWE